MGRKKLEISEEIKEQMRMDSKRMSYKQVAKLYGVGINKTFYIVRGINKRGCKPKANTVQYKAIAEDYLNGLSIDKISKKYYYSNNHIYRILDKQGVKIEPISKSNRTIEIENDIRLGDLTQSEIAKKYGVSRQRVFQIKKGMENNDAHLAL